MKAYILNLYMLGEQVSLKGFSIEGVISIYHIGP